MKADFPEGEEWVQVAFGGDLVAFLVDSKPIEASLGGCFWVLLDCGGEQRESLLQGASALHAGS